MPRIIFRPNPAPPPFVPPVQSAPLTFTAKAANSTIQLKMRVSDDSLPSPNVQYSLDNGVVWNDYTFNSTEGYYRDGEVITLNNEGDKVLMRGNNEVFSFDNYNYTYFQMTGQLDASGDVTSLMNEVGGNIALTGIGFYNLFIACNALMTPPNLPSTTLVSNCYSGMFSYCGNLNVAPELPALSLSDFCYYQMFRNRTALVSAPELPATTLNRFCYSQMFDACTALVTATDLPATTLENGCYSNMFRGCTALVNPPAMLATTLAERCCEYMFNGCSKLTKSPELLAETLVSRCYGNMFYGASKLSEIKAMFLTTPGTTYTENWVKNTAASGTFTKNANATWDVTGVNGIPSGWSVETE